MQPIDILHNQQVLLQRKDELLHLIDGMEKDSLNVSLADSISELSSYDNHPADMGDETFERSKDLALRENAHLEMERIDEALQAIQKGTYGTCAICDKNIAGDRLAVMPEAVTCAACSRRSQEGDRMERPIEEEVMVPPFNIPSGRDQQNQTGYDGEDTWQDVARYGSSDGPQDQPDSQRYPNVVDEDEDRGSVDYVDSIAYSRGKDGMIYGEE